MRSPKPLALGCTVSTLFLIGMASMLSPALAQAGTVTRAVPAATSVGVQVCIWDPGVVVTFQVTGTVMNSGTSGPWGPGGNGLPAGPGFRFPGFPEFSLVAVVDGAPILLSPDGAFPVGAAGYIALVVNDDNYGDNSGAFMVVLTWPNPVPAVPIGYLLGGCCTDGSGWNFRIDDPARCPMEGAAGPMQAFLPTPPGLAAGAVAVLWASAINGLGSADVFAVAFAVPPLLVITAPPGYTLWVNDGFGWQDAMPGPVVVQAPNGALASRQEDQSQTAVGITVEHYTGPLPPPPPPNAPIGGPISMMLTVLCLVSLAAWRLRGAIGRRQARLAGADPD